MLKENQQKKELVLLEDLGMLYPNENSKRKYRFGIYRCYCGNEFNSQIRHIKSGNTKSCGCGKGYHTHGLTNHRLYNIWHHMMNRCFNPKSKVYKYYGERGISVCEEWQDINNFISDMDSTYTDGLSIDRIDVNGNYEQSNCRWATKETQSRNTRLLMVTNTSGYRGVSFNKKNNKFIARITVSSKTIYLGCFDEAIDGAKAYNEFVVSNKLEHTLNIL